MREKVLIPAVLLTGVSLVIGAALIAANEGAGTNSSSGTLPATVEQVAPVTATFDLPSTASSAPVQPAGAQPAPGPVATGIDIPMPTEDTTPPPAEVAQKGLTNTITVNLKDTELKTVVEMFIRLIPEANIMYEATNLTGTVNVHIQNVEWKPALEAILKQKQLGLQEDGPNLYSIVSKPAGQAEPMVVATVFLKYARVQEVSAAIRDSLMPGGKISDFSSRNAIVVRTTRANLTEIQEIVQKIDIPRGQVYIEARFMELSDVARKNLGVNWQMLQGYEVGGSARVLDQQSTLDKSTKTGKTLGATETRDNSDAVGATYNVRNGRLIPTVDGETRTIDDTLTQGLSANEDAEQTDSTTFSDVRTAVLNPLAFNLILSALKSQSGVSVVSNPRILVVNSSPALIHIGERRTPLIPKTDTVDGALKTTYQPGAPIDSGVKLNVTPTINTESNITVEIKPEITRILGEGDWTTAPDGSKYPAIATREITTIFSLLSGETAAIGGLTETTDDELQTKVPVLGDIPLIGKYLFSHTRTVKNQTETIIFVTVGLATPERIENDVGIPGDSKLVHQRLLADSERNRQFNEDLNKREDQVKRREEASDRRQRFLLQRTR